MITIPAACLTQLGGLQDEDSGVLYRSPLGGVWSWHPLGNGSGPLHSDRRLLLPQSYAALARVLMRHKGAELSPFSDVLWVFRSSVESLHWSDGETLRLIETGTPTLTPDMSPLRAFAEAFVWEARVARMSTSGEVDLSVTWPDGLAGAVARFETEGHPEWRVEVTT